MPVADAAVDVVPGRSLPIAPRTLARILRDVSARDIAAAAPADRSLADLDAEASAELSDDVARVLRRAVVEQIRRRSHLIAKIKPFTEMSTDFAFSDLELSVRAFNAITRFPHAWLREATIGDLLDTPGLGAGVLAEVLAAYEAATEFSDIPLSKESADPLVEGLAKSRAPQAATSAPIVPPRVRDMWELYATGLTLDGVAGQFGVTRERVRQLFVAHGFRTRSVAETAALRRQQAMDQHRRQIIDLLGAGAASHEVAQRLSVPAQIVRDVRDEDPSRRRLAAFRRNTKTRPTPRFSDEEIVECLRTASVEIGGVLTTAEYTSFARLRKFPDGRRWPSHQTPALRFGSWRAALQRAGLEANPPSAIAGQRLFTREHCVDAILEVERELGHPPTAAEYERTAGSSRGVLPSLATVRHRCGGWQHALVFASRFSQ